MIWVLRPLTHRLPIDIVYKHTNANIETGLTKTVNYSLLNIILAYFTLCLMTSVSISVSMSNKFYWN